MNKPLTFGLARMHVEYGEKRDFLPPLVVDLEKRNVQVFLEHGYGAGMGLTEEDYRQVAPNVKFVSHQDVYKQQFVLVLRCPDKEDLQFIEKNACLISMLHYPTRPQRVAYLKSLDIEAISLDSLKDETGRRMIENLRSVAWNGLETGFQVLRQTYPNPGMESMGRDPVQVTVLGVGEVGKHAVQAASRYGDIRLWKSLASRGVPGVQVTAIEHDLTNRESVMKELLSRTDILVDATQRPDTSRPVIPNSWIAWLPDHAVLVDLSVDPYNCSVDPIETKGIEGIPQGNLDQYVFKPDDPAFDRIPNCIPTGHRRHVVSCYSWPGIHPKKCMKTYGAQVRPVLRTIIRNDGIKNIKPKGSYFQRAIYRALLSTQEMIEYSVYTNRLEKET